MWRKLAGIEPFRRRISVSTDDLGAILVRAGRGGEAITWLSEGVKHAPELGPLWFNLGTACLAENRVPEAEQHLQRSVTLDPGNAGAREWLGRVHLGLVDARSSMPK